MTRTGKDEIAYTRDRPINPTEFKSILERSGLAARRPVSNVDRLKKMLAAYTFVVSAWQGDRLVGISTVWTDWAFSAYLADLAVDRDYQKRGIGRRLVEISKQAVGPEVTLILLSAPDAANYYPKIGMERFADCFLLRRSQ
jgi:ribosomal protein S18 acetylase RimI-like enzyme